MKKKKIFLLLFLVLGLNLCSGFSFVKTGNDYYISYNNDVFADGDESEKEKKEEKKAKKKNCTSILPSDWCAQDEDKAKEGDSVMKLLNIALTVITAGVSVLGLLGIVMAGLQYTTARDNEAQMAAAKKRILEVIIGLGMWVLFSVIVNFIVLGKW